MRDGMPLLSETAERKLRYGKLKHHKRLNEKKKRYSLPPKTPNETS